MSPNLPSNSIPAAKFLHSPGPSFSLWEHLGRISHVLALSSETRGRHRASIAEPSRSSRCRDAARRPPPRPPGATPRTAAFQCSPGPHEGHRHCRSHRAHRRDSGASHGPTGAGAGAAAECDAWCRVGRLGIRTRSASVADEEAAARAGRLPARAAWAAPPPARLPLLRADAARGATLPLHMPPADPLELEIIGHPNNVCLRQVEHVSISRDTTESDLKQRREIRGGSVEYSDQPVVEAALHGRVLVRRSLASGTPQRPPPRVVTRRRLTAPTTAHGAGAGGSGEGGAQPAAHPEQPAREP